MPQTISPRSGASLLLGKGQLLSVIDPEGEQVSDLVAFNASDRDEYLSSGRSIDYASRIFLTKGDILYSNRSNPMLSIVSDDVGRHDFLVTPCPKEMFRIIYKDEHPHHGCQGNLEMALAPHGMAPDRIPIAFNVFMNVDVNGQTREIKVLPPRSKPGDRVSCALRWTLSSHSPRVRPASRTTLPTSPSSMMWEAMRPWREGDHASVHVTWGGSRPKTRLVWRSPF